MLEKAIACRPSSRQLAWQKMEFYGFVHFTVNTFTDKEWGDGTEDPRVFAPTATDARSWAKAARAAGMKGLILTAKHHDGFCLWPSRYTEHSVKAAGQPDWVRLASEACREEGLAFGVYLSPWDRHDPRYGSGKDYDDYYCNQLEELTTQYGPLFTVWLDGACGEGPNGKKQVYDFERYYAVVRKNQPDACISITGPDVRWCGNEAGKGRESEFSVVPAGAINCEDADLGSRERLGDGDVRWYPAEVDTSIRKGWFWHEEEEPRTLADLQQVYLASAGNNACLLLNLPPDRRGMIPEQDAARLKELGDWIAQMKGHAVASGLGELSFAETWVDRAILHEDIARGQRVERAALELCVQGKWQEVASCGAIGYQKILTFPKALATGARLRINQTRAEALLLPMTIHQAMEV